MALSGNKGDWGELYTMFRLLGEGKVHAGGASMKKLCQYYPILSIIRNEAQKYEYDIDEDHYVVILNGEGVEYARIPMATFLEESKRLLADIKKVKGERAFKLPATEEFMGKVGCSKIKIGKGNKADIHIVMHDYHTNMTQKHGFSIKTQFGNPASLLNASRATNILYTVTGNELTDKQIEDINNIEDQIPRMMTLLDAGCKLEYKDIENQTFKNNLLFIDYCMPKFIADCLLVYSMPNSASNTKDVVQKVAESNPLDYTGKNIKSFYEHKMKVLLIDAALGMVPKQEWNGRYDANGGYIVARKDGEIVCYHFYDKSDVEDYLYNNTRFDKPGRKKHEYGTLFRHEDGTVCIRLNLQIRFKK